MADETLLDRIAKLEAMNEVLLQRIAELGSEIQRTRTGGFRSMRDARRCPACGEGSLVHVRRVQESGAGRSGLTDFALAHSYSRWTATTKPFGPMESFACRSCGLVEYHVIDWKDVPIDGQGIVAIEPDGEPPKAGPFR